MQLRNEITDTFWGLFRSVNREIYIDALLYINEEYQYNNYFLTKEACIQVLSDMNARKRYELQWEESESEFDMLETPSSRILNWLLRTGWLKRIEDYNTLVTNIVIPDYSAIFIDAFERLSSEDMEETDIYIQNVYATLFSFQNNARANLGMLRTALVNTRRLNKALQDMLHNMDKFFARLLDQKSYGDLLREHLDGYVEEIVRKKYHILKTSDNFYIYKMDIKKCLRDMREDEAWIGQVRDRSRAMGDTGEDVLELLDQIERGFDDIEHRIANMDKEHTKYVRATVTRLNYLLSGESDTKGLVIKLLNRMSESADYDDVLAKTGEKMNLSLLEILSEKSLYKRRKGRQANIGVAMGITGSEVSKDAAAMVLTDDNFATIIKAVENGRNIYQNIKNSIQFLLSGNFGAILAVLYASIAGLPVPFAPVHLLFINLLTDSLPAIALGLEPHSKEVMKQKPRPMNESILTKQYLLSIGTEGLGIGIMTMAAFLIGYRSGDAVLASTMAFGTLCTSRLVHGFNCKSSRPVLFTKRFFNNIYLIGAFLIGLVLITGVLMIPGLQGIFKVESLNIGQLLTVYGLALLNLPVVQLLKWIRNSR